MCEHTNCWAAVGAWMVRGATRGKRKPSPMAFRRKAGALRGCRTGGLGDIMRGLSAYGIRFRMLHDVPKANARKRWASKTSTKLYAVETDFDRWPSDKKCGPYSGYHMIGLAPGLNKRKAVRTMDPNRCRKLKWVPVSDVLASALEYNREHHERPGTIDMLAIDTKR